jgi:hypothetical protein
MIPEPDSNGNLPPGVHNATLEEIADSFGGKLYLSRRDRTNSLIDLYDFVRDFAIGLYINGSYITTKFKPSDVDVMIILPEDFEFDSYEGRQLLRMRRLKKANHLDIWPYAIGRHKEEIQNILRGWTTDIYNNNAEKGIIYLEL